MLAVSVDMAAVTVWEPFEGSWHLAAGREACREDSQVAREGGKKLAVGKD